jgi:hypothetical protein
MRQAVALGAALLTLFFAPAFGRPAPPSDPWAKLSFLVGEWRGIGAGAPGEGIGGTAFAFDLDKNVLIRKNWATYPPKAGETKGLSHEDLMIVYPAPGGAGLKAIYFDNESHVIEYAVSFPGRGYDVVFKSDPAEAAGPRFRLDYSLAADGRLTVVFSMAAPGGDFKEYARGVLVKKG